MPEEKVVKDEQIEKPVEKNDDLVQRVSQVKSSPNAEKFNINDLDAEIEKVQDPKVKEQLLGLKKSLISGENQKYQEIAQLRKDLENQKSSNWTSERVQELLKDQSFVKAAQDIIVPDEGSMLTESEKALIKAADQKASLAVRQAQEAVRLRQDESLKNKYANYSSEAVDVITDDLLKGRVQATREHLHKVLDYDNAIKRAYLLGKEDKKLETTDKIDSTSPDGFTATRTEVPLERLKGESDMNYWKRLGEKNLAKQK